LWGFETVVEGVFVQDEPAAQADTLYVESLLPKTLIYHSLSLVETAF
jgi:hypothetical protein